MVKRCSLFHANLGSNLSLDLVQFDVTNLLYTVLKMCTMPQSSPHVPPLSRSKYQLSGVEGMLSAL